MSQGNIRVLATFGPPQSRVSLGDAREALREQGIDLEMLHIDRRAWRFALRSLLQDAQLLTRLLTRSCDLMVLNSGIMMMHRRRLLGTVLRICRFRKIAVLALWQNAAGKFDEIVAARGSKEFARAARLMLDPAIRHLAISRRTAREVADRLAVDEPACVYNCRKIAERDLTTTEPASPPVVLAIASMQHRKGPDLFVKIAASVVSRRPDVQFRWVGGLPTVEIDALVNQLHLANNIAFIGHTTDPFAHIRDCSLLLLTSREEAFGLVVAEAMACYRTVACFSQTGAAEIAGETGIVLPSQDTDAAAEAILAFLEQSPRSMVNLAAHADYRSKYSPEAYARRLAGIVREQIDRLA